MSKYRFKTKEEFIKDGRWLEDCHCPIDWNWQGEMNKFLGKDITEFFEKECDKRLGFDMEGWAFGKRDYVLKEQIKNSNIFLVYLCI